MKWGAILLAAAAALTIAGCREAEPRAAEVRPVRVMTVDPKPIDDDRQAVGEIRARHESDLAFRVAGKVIARLADIGAAVKKDDVLARLDDQEYRSKLQSTEADVASAEAVLVEVQGTENRSRQLLASGTTTQANYDSALRNLRSSEAKLTSTRASRDLARDQLAYTELHADFDGIVTATGAEPGQVVNIGQMIVRLARPEAKDAVFNIAEAAFKDRPKEEELGISVWLLANPGVTADGVVREISPVADPVTRTYQVKVTLKSPPEQMRLGASVAGQLKSVTAPVAVLPASALFDKAGKPAVWIVDAAQGAVTLKPVTVARYETDRVIVSGGLSKGDVVVTAGVHRLFEGQKVRLAEGAAQ